MDAADLSGAIVAEQRLLDPAVRADPAAVAQLLDPDSTEIGQTGSVWTRSAVIEALAAASSGASVTAVSDWYMRAAGDGLALVSYETRRDGVRVRRTTLWRQRDAVWRAVAHLGTRVVD